MQWTSYIFVRFVLFVILGVFFYDYTHLYFQSLPFIFTGLFIIYCLLIYFTPASAKIRLNRWIGLVAFSLLFLFGWQKAYQHTAYNSPANLSHLNLDSINAYKAVVSEEVQNKEKTHKTVLKIQEIKIGQTWRSVSGKILLYISKDSSNLSSTDLLYGSVIIVKGTPIPIPPPKNPFSFNYAHYLYRQNTYHQHFIKSFQYKTIAYNPEYTLWRWTYANRTHFRHVLEKYITAPQEEAIASALLLGIKDNLDSHIRKAYASAGLMHILAVSGLHIGIISTLLTYLLFPIRVFPYGKGIAIALLLLSLWGYAFITGLPTSVLRATVMFSLISTGQILRKQSTFYNTLAVSAFVLLCFDPFVWMSVGFQLSYIAVAGIVYLQPKLDRWITPSSKVLHKLWELITVSVAAQIATFPLTIFYFHQFPCYFLIANILILGWLFIVLYWGIITLLFSWIPGLATEMGWVLEWMLYIINYITFQVAKLPGAVYEGISISLAEMFFLYAWIILLLMTFHYRKFVYTVLAFCSLLIFTISILFSVTIHSSQEKLIIYHLPKYRNICILEGFNGYWIADSALKSDQKTLSFHVVNHLYNLDVQTQQFIPISSSTQQTQHYPFAYTAQKKYALLIWKTHRFLFLKEPLNYKDASILENVKVDYVVIQNKAIRNLTWLVKYIKVPYLIIDATYSEYYHNKFIQQAQNLHIPYYSIRKKGAFILEK